MKFTRTMRLVFTLVVTAIFVSLFESLASAQCAMCRASLAGSNNAAFIRNFNIGVLVLLVPPVAMFCSFFVVLRRHKDQDDQAEASELKRDETGEEPRA